MTRSWLRSGRKGGSWNTLTLRPGQFRKGGTRGPDNEHLSGRRKRNLYTTLDRLSCDTG